MTPLITPTPIVTGAIICYMLGLAAFWLYSAPLMGAKLVVLAIFTFGLQVDFGIAMNPARILGIVSFPVMLLDRSLATRDFFRIFGFPIAVIACYAAMVTALGVMDMPDLEHRSGGLRARQWRPFVAYVTYLFVIPLIWTVYVGLYDRQAIYSFFDSWISLAIGSVALGIVQELSFLAGTPLWGILREEGQLPFITVAGVNFLRFNAFSGEPKQLGINLVFTLALLLGYRGANADSLLSRFRILIIGGVLFGILMSFSSGAYLAVGLLGVFSLFMLKSQMKSFTVFGGALLVFVALLFPGVAEEFYQQRIYRIQEKLLNSAAIAEGAASVERASDDKENAAAAYIIQNPSHVVFGLGIGTPPYYYNHLVVSRYRDRLQEPNSGLNWVLLSIGIVGLGLFYMLFRLILSGQYLPHGDRPLLQNLVLCMVAIFVPMHPFDWLAVLMAVATCKGWYLSDGDNAGQATEQLPQAPLAVY